MTAPKKKAPTKKAAPSKDAKPSSPAVSPGLGIENKFGGSK